jgi:diguanylate cyclase (GGDEF)-like protein/PAS domain S-box-containing protein
MKVRYYAGAPLVMDDGERVGTLCVIDHEARQLDETQASTLRALGDIVTLALTMRRELITKTLSVRSQYETQLASSEARHRSLVEDQSEFVSLADANGKLVYVNPAFMLHFSDGASELIGSALYTHIAGADSARIQALAESVLRHGESRSADFTSMDIAGNVCWVSWRLSLQRAGDGKAMLHAVGRDITARKQTEQALRDSQAFLARTGRVAGVGGWEIELPSERVTWSPETRLIYEVDGAYQPTLATAIDFYDPSVRETLRQAVRRAIEQNEPWDLELPALTVAGRPIWVRVVGEAERVDGQLSRLVGALQDITDRKMLEQALASQDKFVRQITDSLPVHVCYLDRDGRYRFANTTHCLRFDRARDDVIGRTRAELLGDALDPDVEARLALALGGEPQQFEYDVRLGDAIRRVETQAIPDFAEDGSVRGIYATSVDVTARTANERALRDISEQQQRHAATLRSVTEAIPAMVSVIGVDQRYRFVNAAFAQWRDMPAEQIVGLRMADVLGADDYARSGPWMERVLSGVQVTFEKAYPGGLDLPARHVALTYVPLWLDGGQVDGFVSVSQDVTLHKLEANRLKSLSQHDKLTGLLNRAGLEHWIDEATATGPVAGARLGLLYIDLDHFKPVNDTHGHAIGDELLKHFARRLTRLVRPTDAVVRLGGDEFAIVLAEIHDISGASVVAAKVVAAAKAPFDIKGLRLKVGASVGYALGIDRPGGWAGLLRRADAMLYQAKKNGRGRLQGESVEDVRVEVKSLTN